MRQTIKNIAKKSLKLFPNKQRYYVKYLYVKYLFKKSRLNKSDRIKINFTFNVLKTKDKNSAYYFLDRTVNSLLSVKKYRGNGLNSIKQKKNSDKIFILGSGPSINELGENEWSHISKHDSWGFNFWFSHPFIPTSYIVQATSGKDFDQIMKEIMIVRINDYLEKKCIFYARGDMVNAYLFHEKKIGKYLLDEGFEISYLAEYFIPSGCKVEPEILVNKMYSIGCFDLKENFGVPKFGSTIGLLIPLALMVAYREIILCGIDMNNNSHFFDSNYYWKKYPGLKKISEKSLSIGEQHPHKRSFKRQFSVKNYIVALNRLAQDKFKSNIKISSTTSSLYPEITLYKFDK